MPGIEFTSRGPLFDGTASATVTASVRRWMQGVLRLQRDLARSIAPVKTGAFRRSLTYRTRVVGKTVEGEMSSTDIPGKVGVIEYGFPARPLKRGGMGKGRAGRYVFKTTYEKTRGLMASQSRILGAEIAKDLTR